VVLGLIYIVFTNFTADKILLRTYALICLVGIIDTTVSAVNSLFYCNNSNTNAFELH